MGAASPAVPGGRLAPGEAPATFSGIESETLVAKTEELSEAPVAGGPRRPRRVIELLNVRLLDRLVDVVQYAIVVSLLLVAAVVLVRTVVNFLDHPAGYPASIIGALDGILVVIILLDILRTVLSHFHESTLPVRPFLIIGILAAVRDILSASAHLTLNANLTQQAFRQALVELGVGVGVVVALLVGLLLLRMSGGAREADD
ncbi:MAG: phosphate-starvation-inducible PsiE family protein [Acidimicrobiales bacterium]